MSSINRMPIALVSLVCATLLLAAAPRTFGADRYWVGATTNETANWNTTNSWSTTSGGPSGASVPGPDDDVYFDGAGGFIGGCVIDADVDVASITATTDYEGAGDDDGHIDNATHNHTIDVSGDVTVLNKMNSTGDGHWTVGGNWQGSSWPLSNMTVGEGELRMTGDGKTLAGWRAAMPKVVIEGSISSSYDVLTGGVDVPGTLTIPSQSGVNGAIRVLPGGTITGSGTLALGYSSGKITQQDGTIDVNAMTIHFSNPLAAGQYDSASVSMSFNFSNERTWTFGEGTYIFNGDVEFTHNNATGTLVLDASVNNPSFVFGGDVLLIEAAAGDIDWSPGTGTITFSGAGSGTQTINFPESSLEDLVVDDAGATKKFEGGWTADSFEATAGTVDFNGQTVETDGNFTIGPAAQAVGSGFSGASITVGGDLSLVGKRSAPLNLQASSHWTLSVAGTADANHVKVAHSDASGGSTVTAFNSGNYGNNTNWEFVPTGTVISIR